MKNKRTKKSAIIACGIAAVIAVSGAFAFMSDHDNAINKFNFVNADGDQSIDVQLTESNWNEANGANIVYGTPIAKNPVATNVGENDMYAFASVILPAKDVVVQNTLGQIVDVNDTTITDLAAAGLKTTIVNNVSNADKAADTDETEILGVFKDADLTTEYEYGEALADTVYFKLNTTSPLGTLSQDGTYKVLEDTVDQDNYTSDKLGHQFMLKVEADDDADIAVRELYTLEVAGDNGAERITSGAWTAHTKGNDTVYSRFAVNDGWVEITDDIDTSTIYVDADGRIYSAHVFFYDAALAKDESTAPVFDYVELVNLANGQVEEEDDMNIYVETYGVQVSGTADALGDTSANTAEGGVILWNVLTNSENQTSFDLFGVVKDTND